ncbi:MAG TPA: hypothetical protein ACHBZA_03885 [Arsenophonus apicola]|uniref:hypothetical protein n=1 Tax=Arsenophonus TaxID=637 RepID=UPI0015D77FDB|nr:MULTISPECIES: hypothetical protein [Arsenophonus]UBX29999.1 hypothetical protein LDL57_05075 [Arsenophonus apicola]
MSEIMILLLGGCWLFMLLGISVTAGIFLYEENVEFLIAKFISMLAFACCMVLGVYFMYQYFSNL